MASSADQSDPGSWNRYAYTRGDPVNRGDPSGMFDVVDPCEFDGDCGDGGGGFDGWDQPIFGTGDDWSGPPACLTNPTFALEHPSECGGTQSSPPILLPGNTGDGSKGGRLAQYRRALGTLDTFSATSPKCLTDLNAVHLSSAEVDSLAANVNFASYTTATAAQQAQLLGDGADLATNSAINTIYYVDPNLAKLSFSNTLGEMLHEIIHLSGFGGPVGPNQDTALQAALGLKQTLNDTSNISKKLAKDCFKGAK